MTRTTLYSAMFILIFIASVSAFDEDFFVSAPQDTITVCQCGSITNTFTVRNNNLPSQQLIVTISDGDTQETTTAVSMPSTYSVAQTGSAAGWSNLFPSFFSLESGEMTALQNIITVPCRSAGNYDLTTRFQTSLGNTKEVTQKVNVQKCDNIGTSTVASKQAGCPCTVLTYEFVVTNTASFFETYLIGATKNAYITFSDNEFMLAPGESRTVYGYFYGPCGLSGAIDFKILIKANGNSQIKELPMRADIAPCYDFEVVTGESIRHFEEYLFQEHDGDYHVCEKEPAIRIPIRVFNTAEITNSYTFTLKGPKWAALSHNTAAGLETGDYTEILIELNPWAHLDETAELRLSVKTDVGNLEKMYVLPVHVQKCHTPELFEGIKRIGVNYSIISTLLPITNDGNQETTYRFSVDLSWAEIRPEEMTLMPGETTNIELITFPGEDVEGGRYDARISALSTAKAVEYSKDIKITLTQGNWYDFLSTGFSGYMIYLLIGLLLLILIIISLALAGRKKKAEESEDDGDHVRTEVKKARLVATQEALARSEDDGDHVRTEVKKARLIDTQEPPTKSVDESIKGERREVPEKTDNGLWKKICLIILIILLLVGGWYIYMHWGDSFTTLLVRNESEDPGLEPIEEPTDQAPGMFKRAWEWMLGVMSLYLWYILIGILLAIIIIILLSIGGKKRVAEREEMTKDTQVAPLITERKAKTKAKQEAKQETKEKPKKKLWWVALSLILLIIILFLAAYFGYTWYHVEEKDSPETIEIDFSEVDCLKTWPKNTPAEINLSVGFTDPDGDELTFTSDHLDYVIIEIDRRGIATITPEQDFVGVVEVQFYADDGRGFIVPTGSLSLCITDEEPDPVTQTWNFITNNRTYIIVGLAIILVIVLLIIFNKEIIKFLEEDDKNPKS